MARHLTLFGLSLALLIVFMGACVQGGSSSIIGQFLLEKEMEMEMDSEINRRMLWVTQKKYISYEALKGNVVPCSKPGAPYYNCHGLPRANPYTRGCSAITRCARDADP